MTTTFYHDTQRQLLIYPRSDVISRVIPEAREVNGQFVAVPHNLRNSQILCHYNYPIAPIMEGYHWPRAPHIKHPYESQKIQANFLVTHPRAFCLSDMGCVDADTEFLSPAGWKRISDWGGERVAQYDPSTKAISFVVPEFVKKPCKEMIRFKTTRGIDQLLSPEHRVLLADGDVLPADALEAQYGPSTRFKFKFRTTFTVKGTAGLNLSEAQIRLQIAVNADGYQPKGKVHVRLKKPRKIQRLRMLLAAAEVPYDERPCLPEGFAVFVFVPPQPKHAFENWWEATQQQLEIIADEVTYWDGSFGKKGRRSFFSGKRSAVDFVQYAYSAAGSRSRIRTTQREGVFEYSVGAKAGCSDIGIFGRDADGTIRKNIWRESSPDGYKYCFVVPTSFLLLRRNDCIFATGNTGKTMSLLWAADWLMQQHPKGTFRVLIICPLSIMERVWKDAIFKTFLDTRSIEILHGDALSRRKALAKKADFSIINFDGVGVGAHVRKQFTLDGFSKELAEDKAIQLIIVDEASGYRDAQTKRHRLARMIFGDRPYIWLATGTPTPNAPTDAYGLAKIVNNAWGKSFTTFRLETMLKLTQFKWIPQRDGYEKARRLLSPSIRYAIEDVWDAPELTTQQREVELSPEQKKHMADLKRDLQVQLKQGALVSAANEAAARTKFIQISLGAIYDEKHKAHAINASPRIEELKAVIDEAPGKILIFAPLTSVVELLYKELKSKFACEIVNGDISQKDRSRIFQAFQEKENPRILIADPGTMAHGLDLWQARTVIWYGVSEKTELYLQANKRAHRPGQKFPVTVVQLVSNALEKEIFRRLETNTTLQGVLLDAVRKGEI